jgi:hypothetical protein
MVYVYVDVPTHVAEEDLAVDSVVDIPMPEEEDLVVDPAVDTPMPGEEEVVVDSREPIALDTKWEELQEEACMKVVPESRSASSWPPCPQRPLHQLPLLPLEHPCRNHRSLVAHFHTVDRILVGMRRRTLDVVVVVLYGEGSYEPNKLSNLVSSM